MVGWIDCIFSWFVYLCCSYALHDNKDELPTYIVTGARYRKQRKLSGRKVSQFVVFYHNVEKTFVAFEYIPTLKMALIKLVGKPFAVHQKSVKTANVFSHLNFVVYSRYS